MDFFNSKLSTLDIILLIAYAVISIVIGIISSRRQDDEDFLIAGRKMGLGGFIASVVASYVGGAAIVAYTAFVYQLGISAITLFLGTAIGFLAFIPYALKLRAISGEKKFHTLSDWFFFKFDTRAGLLSACILFIVYFGMLLNQFIAGSSILAGISGWNYESALLFSSLIITIYLFIGGFKSVIKTDIFQYLILIVLLIVFSFVLVDDKQSDTIKLLDMSDVNPMMSVIFAIFGVFIVFQSAEYWQRVYAAKNDRVVKRGLIGSAVVVVITGFILSMIGLAAHFRLSDINPSEAFAHGITLLIPQEYAGAGLVLIFAAIMSSADTIIFVLASSVAKDFSVHFRKKGMDSHQLMRQTRLFILVFALLGFVFAYFFRDIIEVFKFITGLGFSILPAAIASFHWDLKKRAVVASFIAGIVYIIVLIITGYLVEELAIASLLVSGLTLLIFQQIKPSRNN